jgi:hypothetical protein
MMLAQGRALARRHTMLSLPLVALLAVMIASAALRMKLYVHYYALSTDRFYPLVFMVWLGVVLVWLSATVLRGWNRPFLAGVAATAFATLVGLNVSAPDRIVASVNVSRASTPTDRDSLDVVYLAGLSGEAADFAVQAVLLAPSARMAVDQQRARCLAARRLIQRWGSTSPAAVERIAYSSWRMWNAGEAAGLAAVSKSEAQLRSIVRGECAELLGAAKTTQR